MSDEQKIEGEPESEDDVEAHTKVRQAKVRQADEASDDDDGDVEAHIKVRQ